MGAKASVGTFLACILHHKQNETKRKLITSCIVPIFESEVSPSKIRGKPCRLGKVLC